MTSRLRSFFDQPDVRAHPARALVRRVRWRLHWKLSPGGSFEIRDWTRGLSIELPNTGAAAQIYHRTFSSPQLAKVLTDRLSPGMHFLDVGAHVGEYSLLAASLVRSAGRVTAIEPQPGLVSLIRENARRNGLSNISVHHLALAERPQRLALAADPRSGGAWLSSGAHADGSSVDCVALDSFLDEAVTAPVDLLKLDAGGNEAAVFAGASRSLAAGSLPRIVYKLYHPDVVAERFGRDGSSIVAMLSDLGYEQALLGADRQAIRSMTQAMDLLGPSWYSTPVLAQFIPRSA